MPRGRNSDVRDGNLVWDLHVRGFLNLGVSCMGFRAEALLAERRGL